MTTNCQHKELSLAPGTDLVKCSDCGAHLDVIELRDLGRFAVPCDCGEEGCQGWQMARTTVVGFSSRIRKAFGAQPHTTGQDKPAG